MKIVCDNCGAKYSIADEKVAGKVFKIRCKKCTNVIVVRGDQVHVQEQEAAAGYDYGGDAVWHVVVDGDQQGPFSPQQLGGMITDGTIDWEAYVWKEGFEGWQPARDVPDLVAAITGESQPAHESAPPAAAAAAAAGGDMGADPFAADPGGSPFGGEAARGAGGDAGADLFAQSDPAASPFGGAPEEDVVASAPSPRVSAEEASMTGQRNENSVLFSLSNLQALATGGGGGSPTPAASGGSSPAPGHATGEGSGLIDIRALASATSAPLGGGSAPTASGGDAAAEDLLSIGGGGGLGGALGAPVLAPAAAEPEQGNRKLLIGGAIAATLVLGLLVALIVVLLQQPEPVADAAQQIAAPAAPPAVSPSAAEPPGAGSAAPAAAMAAETDTDDTDEAEENSGSDSSAMRRTGSRRSSSGMRSSSPSSTPSTAMSEPAPAPARMVSSMDSIDDLLNNALGGGGGAMRAAAMPAMSNLPSRPARDDVARALRGVTSRVGRCGGGTAGVANAAVVFASSGRVRTVRVTGVPPNVQSCVSRAVRGARIPPFSSASFNVNYPFRVR